MWERRAFPYAAFFAGVAVRSSSAQTSGVKGGCRTLWRFSLPSLAQARRGQPPVWGVLVTSQDGRPRGEGCPRVDRLGAGRAADRVLASRVRRGERRRLDLHSGACREGKGPWASRAASRTAGLEPVTRLPGSSGRSERANGVRSCECGPPSSRGRPGPSMCGGGGRARPYLQHLTRRTPRSV